MTLPELEQQILQLPIGDRWRLVQAVLTSIQQDTQPSVFPTSNLSAIADLDPWTQSLVGVMPLGAEDSTEAYGDYLDALESILIHATRPPYNAQYPYRD